jgi:nicotinamidase-related amidase
MTTINNNIPVNTPVLIRQIAERRWYNAANALYNSEFDKIVVERQGRWEYVLEKHENNSIFYKETYLDGLLMRREIMYKV